jgi:hypothetical protein
LENIFIFVFFIKRWVVTKKKSSSSSSTSSFIAGYGSGKPTNGANSTLISSLDSSSIDEIKKRFFDSNKNLHATGSTLKATSSGAIYRECCNDTNEVCVNQPNYNIIDKSFLQTHDPKYFKIENLNKSCLKSNEEIYSHNLSTFGRTLKRNDSRLNKNYVNFMSLEGVRDELILDSTKLSSPYFLFDNNNTNNCQQTTPMYSDLEAGCSLRYLKSLYEEKLAREGGQHSQADFEAMINSLSSSTRIFPRTNPKFRTNIPRVKSATNVNNDSNNSLSLDKSMSTSSTSSPENGSTRRLFQYGSSGVKFVDICSKL